MKLSIIIGVLIAASALVAGLVGDIQLIIGAIVAVLSLFVSIHW